jgi:lipoprotein signal peptidase
LEANESDQPVSATEIPGEPLPAAEEAPTLFAGKLIFWIPIVPLIALDLWSKTWAFALVTGKNAGQFSPQNDVAVFELSWVKFELVTWLNRGTIWGLGDQFHEYLKFLRVGAIALILYFVYKTASKHRWMLLALGLILAGAIGNLYDNFFHFDDAYSRRPQFAGAVRDFIHFFDPEVWNFPAFNVADSCISVGAVSLFIALWAMPNVESSDSAKVTANSSDGP